MHRPLRFLKLFSVFSLVGLAISAVPLRTQTADQLEHQLRDHYTGKTFLLRNFYDGSSLQYDEDGRISGVWASGDWTVDGIVQVDDIQASAENLIIRANREYMGWVRDAGFSVVHDYKGKEDKDNTGDIRALKIEVMLPDKPTAEKTSALLDKIFLTPQDHFAGLVPDYWKECVLAATTGRQAKPYNCHFSPEFLAIPGVAHPPGENLSTEEVGRRANPVPMFVIGQGSSPPKASFAPEPSFSQEARRAKYQGVVTLLVVVDTSGNARDIRIVSPLGFGLDRRAVETVSRWQFEPAKKNDQPIAVEVLLEVDFHLY